MAHEGLARLPVDGRRVLVLDSRRHADDADAADVRDCSSASSGRASRRSTILVALGTHTPMSDAQLSRHVGRPVVDGRAGRPADLQSSLGRSGDVREAGDDSRPRDRAS